MKHIVGLLLMVVAAMACGSHSQSNTEEHAHDEQLQVFAYSQNFEVFAEVSPLAVGQVSNFLVYITQLSDFKPVDVEHIAMRLSVGSNPVQQAQGTMVEKGVYSFALSPQQEGSAQLGFDIATPQGTEQVLIEHIQIHDDEHEAEHYAASLLVSSSNSVIFTKEQSWKVNFATEQSRSETFGTVIKTTAQVMPSQGDERVVTAKASGSVRFAADNIVAGQMVAKGKPLLRIESAGMVDNNMSLRYSEALNEYNRSKIEYERKQQLSQDKIVSESELLTAKTTFDNAQAVYFNLRNNFSEEGQIVVAPIRGFIKQLLVGSGEFVEVGQPLISITQNSTLFIKAELSPKYYAVLSQIKTANIREQSTQKTYTLESLGGKLLSYAKSADLQNPLIPIIFQVNNTADLLSGSFVDMYIKTQSPTHAITIANEALVEEMGNYFVYRQLTPELFEKTEVKIGVSDGLRTEVVQGLEAGQRIVSKGAILVKLAHAAGGLDPHAGHVH
ncbi:MAG: efflux RND transporter periplasmic adaptor subunit [Bacteroidales bacterium]